MRLFRFAACCSVALLALSHGAWAASSSGATASGAKTNKADAATNVIAPRPVFERDGRFGFCIADRRYDDGRKLTIARSERGEINLGVTIPNGGFELGERYDLDLAVDADTPRAVRAASMDETTLLLQMGGSPSFLKSFRAGKILHLRGGDQKFDFNLPDMARLFEDFQACQKRYTGVTDETVKAVEEALPETLKAILVTAGFKDLTPINLEKILPAERPADFMWSMEKGEVVGGVRERLMPKGKSLTEIIGLHLQGLKKKCTGRYKAEIGAETPHGSQKSRFVEVSCLAPKGEKDIHVAMLFFTGAKNKVTTFTFESARPEKSQSARDHLAKTIFTASQ